MRNDYSALNFIHIWKSNIYYLKHSLMKKILTFLAIVAIAFYGTAAKKAPLVTSIDPPYWWTGMANDTLQLFIYGNNVKDAALTLDYPGVKIARVAALDGSAD